MSDVSINVGNDGSSLERSNVTIGDIAGGNIEKRLADHYWQELREIKDRLRAIESFLAGSPLGEPGLTAQVRELKAEVARLEKEIDLIEALDARLERQEAILMRYAPMWAAMERTYSNTTTIPVLVYYGTLGLVTMMGLVALYVLIKGGS